ncbi:MAG: diguanylate cyclase [Lachnospiraceae bacterium]|nr:diguanylate cyclase [Lachnospiraceae bacterium]
MNKRILVVDDTEVILKIAENVLKTNYTVITALTGEDAIAMVEECDPHLILLDVNLPDMSGYDVLEEIRRKTQRDIPCIFMTSTDDNETELKSLELGARDYIHKPFMPNVLLKRIEMVIMNEETRANLEKDADTDPLTGLYNRRAAEAMIDECLIAKQEVGVLLMFDIDNFKQVNDNFGHKTGDRLLQTLSEAMKPYVRSYDLLARLGGDEFIIFYRDFNNVDALTERCRALNATAEYVLNDMLGGSATIPLSISIGVARAPEDGSSFAELYQCADKALYHVKQNGKRGYYFYEGSCNSIHDVYQNNNSIDIMQIRMMIEERSHKQGAYNVEYEDFKNIYRFLRRYGERTQTRAQFVLFTLHPAEHEEKQRNPEDLLRSFGDVAERTLRRGDVAAQYGNNQYMMLLMGTNLDNGKLAAERVCNNWRREQGEKQRYCLDYEIQDLSV